MTDFASLGIRIDSSSVPPAVGNLDKLTAAGTRAEGATQRLGAASRSAGAAAAQMAAQAQASARAATGFATGATSVARSSGLAAYHAQNLAFQLNDVATGLASGQAPMRVLAQQSGQFYQIMQQSGLGVRGFARALLEMTGILKVTRDAELAEEAANASAAAAAVRSAAQRAASNIAAADTELALAQAALRVAATSEAEAAAQARVTAAHEAVTAAAAEATVAETALAEAQGRAAAATAASNARTVVSIGRLGVALSGVGIVAAVALAGIKSFQDEVGRSGELDRFAEGLRLTDSQIEAAGGSVRYLADGTREVTGLTVSFGNIATATYQVLAERAGLSAKTISEGFTAALKWIGDFGKFTISVLLAGFAALVRLVGSLAINLGRLATGQFDQLTNPLADMKKQFFDTFHDVEGGFDKIGARSKELAKQELLATSETNKPPKARQPRKQSDHGLADALAQLDAQIKGQLRLAEAYRISDAAVMRAEALQKAEEQAIRHKGEVGLFYEKELALAVAQRIADGERAAADIRNEAVARARLNDAVAAGTMTAAQANQQLELEAKLRPLLAAAANAHGLALEAAKQAIADVTNAQKELNEQLARENALRDIAANDNDLDRLKLEATLIGHSNRERAVAIAQLEAMQKIKADGITDPTQQATLLAQATQKAQLSVQTPFQQWAATVPQTAEAISEAFQQIKFKGLDSLASALTDVITGTKSLGAAFKDVARSIISDIIQMTIRMLIFRAISGIFGGSRTVTPLNGGVMEITTNAKGNIFSGGKVVPFRNGGVVSSPTLFPMAKGTGLMGEAGEEGILPLTRLPNGDLGVRAANNNQSGPIEVVIGFGDAPEFAPYVQAVAGAAGQQAVKISVDHTNKTLRTLSRPKLMGR